MKIYLDGCDGTGKSTLAKYLSQRFKLDIFCLTKDSEKSIDRYKHLAKIENVVHDRTFLSEVVYPIVFGRENWLSEDDICDLLHEAFNDGIIVICTASISVIRQRILDRHEFEFQEVMDNLDYINSLYQEIARKYNLLIVDTYVTPLKEIGDEIERRLIENGKL